MSNRRESSRNSYIHAGQLRPDLSEDTNMSTVDHIRLEQLKIGCIGVLALELDDITNLLQLSLDPRMVEIALSMDKRNGAVSLIPAILLRQPTRRLRQEEHDDEEEESRKHLQTPRNAEAGRANRLVDEGGTV